MSEASWNEVKFTDTDVVNPGDFIPTGEYNPHVVRPFLLHDHGFVVCLVFASCLQDALDEAVDADKLDAWLLDAADPTTQQDYLHRVPTDQGFLVDGVNYDWNDDVCFLGNALEPFDIESLSVVELPNPKFSFVALFNQHQEAAHGDK